MTHSCRMTEVMEYYFWDELINDCGFLLGGPFVRLALRSLALGQACCHVVRQPCVKAHVARDEGLQEPLEWAWQPLNLSQAFRWDCSPGWQLDCNLVKDLKPATPNYAVLICRNHEIINACCFKLLSFGVIWVYSYFYSKKLLTTNFPFSYHFSSCFSDNGGLT